MVRLYSRYFGNTVVQAVFFSVDCIARPLSLGNEIGSMVSNAATILPTFLPAVAA